MEHEKDIKPKGAESEEEGLFAQLDPGTTLDVIVRIARAGTLQEAVKNIRNLALVNKKFNGLINSEAGINEIIKEGLLENKNIQGFFDDLAQLVKEYKNKGCKFLFGNLPDMNVEDNQRKILLFSLPIKQARDILLQQSDEEWERSEDSILVPLLGLLDYVSKNKAQYSSLFIKHLIFITLRIAKVLMDNKCDQRSLTEAAKTMIPYLNDKEYLNIIKNYEFLSKYHSIFSINFYKAMTRVNP